MLKNRDVEGMGMLKGREGELKEKGDVVGKGDVKGKGC
jgi:hypothetical protein